MRYFPNQRPKGLPLTRTEYFEGRRRARRWEYAGVCLIAIVAAVVFMLSNGGFR